LNFWWLWLLSVFWLRSLNTARTKGADAAVKGDMANIRAQAEIFYDTVESPTDIVGYGVSISTCATGMFNDSIIKAAVAHIDANDYGSPNNPVCNTDSTGQKWAISTTLKGAATAWCIDNSGNVGSATTADVATAGVCQ